MEVNVNGNIVKWKSNFDAINIYHNVANGWQVSAGDYFKFPVEIKGVDLIKFFIKRFNKKSAQISGYDFLVKVKGKKLRGLPIVFDLVEAIEAGHTVIYMFQEFIPGDTFENLQRKEFTFLPSKLGEDLFYALKSIHEKGFWFPDFDPKNFLQSDKGDFFIIDLDSTYSLSVLPAPGIFGGHDFWAPVYEYYRENGNFSSEELKTIKGDLLNHLSLIYLMGLYSFYTDAQGEDLTAYSITRLNSYLLTRHHMFRTTMLYCFNKDPKSNTINQRVLSFVLFKNLIDVSLFPEDIERTISGTPKKPEILSFTANGNTSKELEVIPGNNIVLEWATKDTTSIYLLPQNKLLATTGTMAVEPYEDTTYSIQAVHKYKSITEKSEKSINIEVYDPNLPKPILEFIIEGFQEKAILLEDTNYTIKWKAINAQKVFLNGKEVPTYNTQTLTASKKGTQITHVLKGVNWNEGKSKKSEAVLQIFTEKKPEINFTIVPLIIKPGKLVTLKWESNSGENISISQDGNVIATHLKNLGSMNIPLSLDKGERSRIFRFTAVARSKWGNWPSDPKEQTVVVKKPFPQWVIILLIVIVIIALALFITQYRRG